MFVKSYRTYAWKAMWEYLQLPRFLVIALLDLAQLDWQWFKLFNKHLDALYNNKQPFQIHIWEKTYSTHTLF